MEIFEMVKEVRKRKKKADQLTTSQKMFYELHLGSDRTFCAL